jgi:uncharacterized protein
MPHIFWGALAILCGAVVQGTTGFGIALVAVPVLMQIMPPETVPPMMVVLSLANNAVVLARAWRSVRLRLVLPLIIGGLIGLPFGIWILEVLDPTSIKVAVGLGVVLMAVTMLLGWRRRLRHQRTGLAAVGLLGGVLHTSTSVSGPPVIIFLANQGVEKDQFRANVIAFFTVLNAISIPMFWFTGLLTVAEVKLALVYLIPLVLGSLAGVWLVKRINEQLFRRIVLALVAVSGLALVVNSLRR